MFVGNMVEKTRPQKSVKYRGYVPLPTGPTDPKNAPNPLNPRDLGVGPFLPTEANQKTG